jgi:MFS family permease
MEKLNFSETFIGLVMAGETSALLLICFTLQKLLDKIGIYATLIIAVIIRLVSLYFIASINLEIKWFGLVILHGLGAYLAVLLLQILITGMRFKKYSTIVNALYGMMISLGYSIGPFIVEYSTNIQNTSPLVSTLISLGFARIEVAFSMVFSLLSGLLLLVLKLETPREDSEQKTGLFSIIKKAPGVYWAIAYCGVVIFGITAFITIYGLRNGMEVYYASMLLVAFVSGCIVLEPVYAWFSARFDLRHFLFTNIFVSLIFSAFLPIVIYDFYQSVALLFLWGGANASCYSVSMSILLEKFDSKDIVGANAAFALMDSLGGTLGIILIGIMMNFLGSEGLSYVIMLASILYFSYGLTRYKVV